MPLRACETTQRQRTRSPKLSALHDPVRGLWELAARPQEKGSGCLSWALWSSLPPGAHWWLSLPAVCGCSSQLGAGMAPPPRAAEGAEGLWAGACILGGKDNTGAKPFYPVELTGGAGGRAATYGRVRGRVRPGVRRKSPSGLLCPRATTRLIVSRSGGRSPYLESHVPSGNQGKNPSSTYSSLGLWPCLCSVST